MVTRSVPAKSHRTDYSDKLPDPPRVPDMMEQMPNIAAFLNMLGAFHLAASFVGSGGYCGRPSTTGTVLPGLRSRTG